MGAEVQTSQEVTLLLVCGPGSCAVVYGPGSCATRLATQRQEVADFFLPLLRSSMTTLRSSCWFGWFLHVW